MADGTRLSNCLQSKEDSEDVSKKSGSLPVNVLCDMQDTTSHFCVSRRLGLVILTIGGSKLEGLNFAYVTVYYTLRHRAGDVM